MYVCVCIVCICLYFLQQKLLGASIQTHSARYIQCIQYTYKIKHKYNTNTYKYIQIHTQKIKNLLFFRLVFSVCILFVFVCIVSILMYVIYKYMSHTLELLFACMCMYLTVGQKPSFFLHHSQPCYHVGSVRHTIRCVPVNESLQVVQLQERCLASKWRLSKNLSAHKQSSTAHFEQLSFFIQRRRYAAMTQESQLELETGSSESSLPSQSESSARPCQTLTLDIRNLHEPLALRGELSAGAAARFST